MAERHLTEEQAERLFEEIKNHKSVPVLITELIAEFRELDGDVIYGRLSDIRTQAEAEEEINRFLG